MFVFLQLVVFILMYFNCVAFMNTDQMRVHYFMFGIWISFLIAVS